MVVLDKLLLLLLSILMGLDLRLEMDGLELLLDPGGEMLGREGALGDMLVSNRRAGQEVVRMLLGLGYEPDFDMVRPCRW